MSDETKAILKIAGLLAIGLLPALIALVIEPSRGVAIAAVACASMGIVFVLWTQRLVLNAHQLRMRESVLGAELASAQETAQNQARELRDARTHDAATGSLNRSAFLRRLEETIARDARMGKALSFLLNSSPPAAPIGSGAWAAMSSAWCSTSVRIPARRSTASSRT